MTTAYAPSMARVTSITWSAGTGTFGYNSADGRLVSVTAPGIGGTLACAYDGRLPLSETWSGSAVSGSVSRTFDSKLRVGSEHVDGAAPITFAYDHFGRSAPEDANCDERCGPLLPEKGVTY